MRWKSICPPGLCRGQVAELVEDDEVAAAELVCGAALASGADLGLKVVGQVADVVAPAAGALSDAGTRGGCGKMGLAGAGTASADTRFNRVVPPDRYRRRSRFAVN